MANTHSKRTKPKKPYPTFPLTAHPNGQWCKKIRGKVHFFGIWAEPKSAMEEYNRQAACLHEGRTTAGRRAEVPTVREIANAYLNNQKSKADRKLITPHWLDDCMRSMKDFADFVGKDRPWDDLSPIDFARYRLNLYDRYKTCMIDRTITIVRASFKHAFDSELIATPVRFGAQFAKPTLKEKRQERNECDLVNGKRFFAAEQIRRLLDGTKNPLRAIILLAINGGFGNTDCAELPIAAVDLSNRVIDYARPKTAVQRVVPLWEETAEALADVLHNGRPTPRSPEDATLVFLTRFGNPWRQDELRSSDNQPQTRIGRQATISQAFGRLLKRLNLNRKGLGFYALRHTFRTWADETRDQHAVHRIMGHAIPGMSGVYVEEISIERLREVTDYVHNKLFNLQ